MCNIQFWEIRKKVINSYFLTSDERLALIALRNKKFLEFNQRRKIYCKLVFNYHSTADERKNAYIDFHKAGLWLVVVCDVYSKMRLHIKRF